MKPSDIITESIEHRELEEAPMGFWKNLGYKVAGSVLNPFDSRSLYQGKQEIGKRADALAREFRKYLATVPGNQATVSNLLKWLKFQNLDTAGVERMIGNQSRADINITGIMSNTSGRDSAKRAFAKRAFAKTAPAKTASAKTASAKTANLPTIDASRLDNNAEPKNSTAKNFMTDHSTSADVSSLGTRRVRGAMAMPRTSNVASNKPSGVRQRVEPRLSEATMTFNTVLSPKQIDSFILRAIQDTANKEYFEPSAQIDDQGTRSASSEPTPQQSSSSEPAPQQSSSFEPTPQPSLSTSAQPKDELNDIRRLSGIVQNHEDRIKNLEDDKTDNRVKFTGKKTGT